MIQEQTEGLYLTSPSGELFTHPFFLLATCFAVKPCPTQSELAPVGVKLTKLNKKQSDYINIPVEGPYKANHYRY